MEYPLTQQEHRLSGSTLDNHSCAAARSARVAELTTVETNQAAQVRVGRLLLHPCGVCIAHRSQVVVHHLEGALAGFQPPVGQKKHRCGAALMEGGIVLVTRGYLWTTGWD